MALKQAILIRTDLKMGKGKIASQVAHASLQAFLLNNKQKNQQWLYEGMPKIVLKVKTEEELFYYYELAKKHNLTVSLIKDAGRTQIEPSYTAIAIGPDKEEEIDKITKDLKLL